MNNPRPRILAIDDTPTNLLTLGRVLAADFDLQIATSGAMGLSLAAEAPPDLILLDVMMPEMDGYETCRRLKANPKLHAIPVIFVTALTEVEAESAGLALGAADYITKPINIDIARQRIRNLLEREQLRKAVEIDRDKLEDQVAARTHDLLQANAELAAAKDVAESANRAKSVFLANMSHELRTPLNAILGFAQLMERDARIPEDRRANLGTINKSGQHLLSLINDVLEISRIEAGRLAMQPGAVDLPGLLTTLTESMTVRAEEKGLALRLDIHDTLPRYIDTDVAKLRQVLLNLISNAIKFTRTGEVIIAAAVAAPPESTTLLEFTVHDTGVGIGPDDLERIFSAFYQTEAGISQGEGTGLGLAISREYARLLGGELTVESTPGQGSIFRFRLPVVLAEAPVIAAPRGHIRALSPGQPDFRILIAEDEPVNQELLKIWLEDVGFVVKVANHGREAVAIFQQWQPHFIWMDMRMPVMDGFEATRAIRALPGGEIIPIIAFTASVFEEERKTIMDAGCNDIAIKPFEEDRIFGLMIRYLQARFDYEDIPPTQPHAVDFTVLPATTRERLRLAAEGLDAQTVRDIAEALNEAHPVIAQRIRDLAYAYQFDMIVKGVSGDGMA